LSTYSGALPVAVSYSVENGTGSASLSGNVLSLTGAGTVTVTASVPGDATYWPTSTSQLVTIAKASQSITFNEIMDKTCATAPFTLSASASSGLPLTFTSDDPTVASVSGNVVTILKPGYIHITASQPGNQNYNAAFNQTQPIQIDQADQVVTLDVLPTKTFDDAPFALPASTTSGLPLSFTYDNSYVSITNGIATILKVGSSIIRVTQSGNTCYRSANSLTRTLTVNKVQPIINLTIPQTEFCTDAQPQMTFTTTHNLPVLSNKTGVAIQGNAITFAAGTYTSFRLYQNGDANHLDAYTPYFNIYSRVPPSGSIFTNDNVTFWPGQNARLDKNGFADQYQWLLNHINISGATSTYYNATQSGDYSLRLTENYTAINCSIQTNAITIKVLDDTDITVFPNPANQSFTVQLPYAMSTSTSLKVVSNTGVTKYTGTITSGQLSKVITSSSWSAGNYVLTLTQGSNTIQKTIIVQH
jgi:hypothetical protein